MITPKTITLLFLQETRESAPRIQTICFHSTDRWHIIQVFAEHSHGVACLLLQVVREAEPIDLRFGGFVVLTVPAFESET